MTKTIALAFTILRMMNAPETPALRARAATAAVAIHHAVEREGKGRVPESKASAVAMKESSYRHLLADGTVIRGGHGEIGMFMINPGRMAQKLCGDLDLFNVNENARCGVRYLLNAMERCGDDPYAYLPAYNGTTCGSRADLPKYAVRVLTIEGRPKKVRVPIRVLTAMR